MEGPTLATGAGTLSGAPCAECGQPVGPERPAYRTYRWRRPIGGGPPVREPLVVCGPACLDVRRAVNRRARFGAVAHASAPYPGREPECHAWANLRDRNAPPGAAREDGDSPRPARTRQARAGG